VTGSLSAAGTQVWSDFQGDASPSNPVDPGVVYVAGTGGPNSYFASFKTVLANAITAWNTANIAAGVPVTFTTTPLYSGQAPDVTLQFSAKSNDVFQVTMPCGAPTPAAPVNATTLLYSPSTVATHTLTFPIPNTGLSNPMNNPSVTFMMIQGLGALMGLPIGTTQAACASVMNTDALTYLGEKGCLSTGPTPWDLAYLLNIYAPTQTTGFPSASTVTSGLYALTPHAQSNSLWAPMDWETPTSSAAFQWTFAPQAASTSAASSGYVVNMDNGLCLALTNPTSTNPIQTQCGIWGPQWSVTALSGGGSQLVYTPTGQCLSSVTGGPASMTSCTNPSTFRVTPGDSDTTGRVPADPGYNVVGQGSGKCLNVSGGVTTSGSAMILYPCSTSVNELFHCNSITQLLSVYDSVSTGTAEPGSEQIPAQNLCVTASQSGNGSAVTANACIAGMATQQWTLNGNGNVVNPANGRCLTVQGASTSNLATIIMWDCNTGSNEQWTLQTGFVPNSTLSTLIGNATGTLGSVALTSPNIGRVAGLSTSASDIWTWLPVGSAGSGLIENTTPGRVDSCLGVWNYTGENSSGSSIQQNQAYLTTCDLTGNTANHLWTDVSNSNGTDTFKLTGSNQCLDIWNNNTSNNATIGVYSCGNNYNNQSWRIIALPTPTTTLSRGPRSVLPISSNPESLLSALAPTAIPVLPDDTATVGVSLTGTVLVSGTFGATMTVTSNLFGPVSVGSDGTCDTAGWTDAPVFATATFTVTGDGTYTTASSPVVAIAGCYSYGLAVPATAASSAVTVAPGGDTDTTLVSPSLTAAASYNPTTTTLDESVAITGTSSGYSGTLTGTILGPTSPGPDGTCNTVDWTGAPQLETVTIPITTTTGTDADNTDAVTSTQPVTANGCYTFTNTLTPNGSTPTTTTFAGAPLATLQVTAAA
jgi:hypothetical protein